MFQRGNQGCLWTRVARWYIFKPKIPNWVNFKGSCDGKFWYFKWPFGRFYSYLIYFEANWYILWSFGIFFPVLVFLDRAKSGNPVVDLAAVIYPQIWQIPTFTKCCPQNGHRSVLWKICIRLEIGTVHVQVRSFCEIGWYGGLLSCTLWPFGRVWREQFFSSFQQGWLMSNDINDFYGPTCPLSQF
jgi:hypothetical protein